MESFKIIVRHVLEWEVAKVSDTPYMADAVGVKNVYVSHMLRIKVALRVLSKY